MEAALMLSFSAAILLISTSFAAAAASPLLLLGIHPLDEKHFSSEFINCKDGSKSFNRARLNDDFCDCLDGTDEPGTSACPAGKFYCRNLGSMPLFLFSSRVNDHICDCCDGSDEYDGVVHCPNTCVMGGNIAYSSRDRKVSVGKSVERSVVTDVDNVYGKEGKSGLKLDDLIEKLKGLRMLIVLQVGLISCVVVFRLCQRRSKLRRRRRR